MKWLMRFAFPLLLAASSLHFAPSSVLGDWRIGHPYTDMAPQPVALDDKQEKMLVGQTLTVTSRDVAACGKRVSFYSIERDEYSTEEFLQRYGIRPGQIGLKSPVLELSFNFPQSTSICGNPEGFVIFTDGSHAAFEDGNDYFLLSKM